MNENVWIQENPTFGLGDLSRFCRFVNATEGLYGAGFTVNGIIR